MLRLSASPFLIVCAFLLLSGCQTRKAPPDPAAPAAAALPGSTPAPAAKPIRSPLAYLSPLNWPGMLFPKKAGPPQAQPPQLVGVIKMVNTEDRFVLIDAVSSQGTEAGALLVCIMNQQETANLRMSSLKNPPFLIADIASGTPSPGDRVFKP
ncbi:MAG: hypothetical protein ACOYMS_06715 [Terrimicrobiaceae bacterium]